MNPGLWYLLRKLPVSIWRRVARRARGRGGWWRWFGLGALLLFLVVPQVVVAWTQDQDGEQRAAVVDAVRRWGPVALLMITLASATSGYGLYFRRPEIDLLFPAPIRRRELLLYQVIGGLAVISLSALWIALFTLRHAPTWYGGLLGLFLALAFVRLCSLLFGLLLSIASQRAARGVKLGAWAVVVAAVGVGLLELRSGAVDVTLSALAALADSAAVQTLTAPLRPFAEVFVAEDAGAFLGWSATAIAILALLTGLILGLDVAYTEGAVRRSRVIEDRIRSAAAGRAIASRARVGFPRLPRCGGIGPIAWRQSVEMVRNVYSVLWLSLVVLAVPMVVGILMSNDDGSGPDAGAFALGMLVMFTAVVNQPQASYDFKRDLDRLVLLKTLPIEPWRLALGELLPHVAWTLTLQCIAMVVIDLVVGLPSGVELWMAPALLLPFDLLAVAVDNALFLSYPYRIANRGAGPPQFLGRVMLTMMAKGLVLVLCAGAAAAVGVVPWSVHPGFGVAATAVVLGACALGAVAVVGRAFRDFDIARDLPE